MIGARYVVVALAAAVVTLLPAGVDAGSCQGGRGGGGSSSGSSMSVPRGGKIIRPGDVRQPRVAPAPRVIDRRRR